MRHDFSLNDLTSVKLVRGLWQEKFEAKAAIRNAYYSTGQEAPPSVRKSYSHALERCCHWLTVELRLENLRQEELARHLIQPIQKAPNAATSEAIDSTITM